MLFVIGTNVLLYLIAFLIATPGELIRGMEEIMDVKTQELSHFNGPSFR